MNPNQLVPAQVRFDHCKVGTRTFQLDMADASVLHAEPRAAILADVIFPFSLSLAPSRMRTGSTHEVRTNMVGGTWIEFLLC